MRIGCSLQEILAWEGISRIVHLEEWKMPGVRLGGGGVRLPPSLSACGRTPAHLVHTYAGVCAPVAGRERAGELGGASPEHAHLLLSARLPASPVTPRPAGQLRSPCPATSA